MSITGAPAERRVAVVIEDDMDIRHLLESVLTQGGFETISIGNGEDGVKAVQTYDPIVTTLDVSLPGIDGFETARRIRAVSNTYIVMISARDEEIDTLQGLDSGADDYLTKPFRPRELRSRIEAMLRRPRAGFEPAPTSPVEPMTEGVEVLTPEPVPVTGHPASAPQPAVPQWVVERPAGPASQPEVAVAADGDGPWLEHNGLRLDADARVVEVDGDSVDLTRSEFDLMQALLESRRRVRTKADLALVLRGESYVTTHYIGEADRRGVEVHMANLRRKIGDTVAEPRFIVTVRGVGYRLADVGGAVAD